MLGCRLLEKKNFFAFYSISLYYLSQEAVMEHLATKGPLAVAVAANDWSRYAFGVFDGCSYDRNVELNHGKSICQEADLLTLLS